MRAATLCNLQHTTGVLAYSPRIYKYDIFPVNVRTAESAPAEREDKPAVPIRWLGPNFNFPLVWGVYNLVQMLPLLCVHCPNSTHRFTLPACPGAAPIYCRLFFTLTAAQSLAPGILQILQQQ